jgi:hypothetical protein
MRRVFIVWIKKLRLGRIATDFRSRRLTEVVLPTPVNPITAKFCLINPPTAISAGIALAQPAGFNPHTSAKRIDRAKIVRADTARGRAEGGK